MNKQLTVLLFFTVVIFFFSCRKDFDYPLIQTGEVTDIDSTGAIFHGKIINLGEQEIIDYGFVWNMSGEPNIENSYRKSLGETNTDDLYSTEINSAFIEGSKYYVRAFIKNKKTVVYGRDVSFISLGSKAPKINSFLPDTATWGDTIIITGENFSNKNEENKIEFGGFSAIPINSTDLEIITTVPYDLNLSSVNITVSVLENITISDNNFHLTPPEINDFNPKSGTYQTTVEISGKYFHPYFTVVYFDSIQAEIININFNTITAEVPSGLPPGEVDLSVIAATQEVISDIKFNSLSPDITGFTPTSGTFGDEITIQGYNFSTEISENTVKFGEIEATVTQASENNLKVLVPNSLYSDSSHISVTVKEQTAFSEDNFTLLSPIITSFSPQTGTFGDEITIQGNYFSNNVSRNIVKFGDIEATVTEADITELKVLVPNALNIENSVISVTVFTKTAYSNESFTLLSPIINSFFPTSGTFGDEITITGHNFNPVSINNTVKFGDTIASVTHCSSNEIKVLVPNNYYSENGKLKISVEIGEVSDISNEYFELLIHTISNFTPNYGSRGDVITITGQNFNPVPEYNTVNIGNGETIIESATPNTITVIVSEGVEHGNQQIKLEIAGREVVASGNYMIYEPWTQLADFGGGVRKYAFGFSIDDKGYIGAGKSTSSYKNDLWEYDPISDTWTEKGNLPNEFDSWTYVSFTTTSYAYVVFDEQLWRYNHILDQWSRKADFPGSDYWKGRTAFSIDNNGYVGTGGDGNSSIYHNTSEFWKYNESSNTWTNISDYGGGNMMWGIGFSLNGKGYVGLGDPYKKELWEYNPISNSWVYKFNFTGIIQGIENTRIKAVGLSNDGKGYIATGTIYNNGTSWPGCKDIYQYDPLTNSCIRSVDMPAQYRLRSVGFSINNKVYIGTGQLCVACSSCLDDFWEFDPSKLKPE